MIIITFGTFDLFHIGHLNILTRCKNYNNTNNTLVVGISTDEFNFKKKNIYPVISFNMRKEIVHNIKGVDIVFAEHSLEDKLKYCLEYKADILIMGSDHIGRFDYLKEHNIDVIYLERTNDIDTSSIIKKIQSSI